MATSCPDWYQPEPETQLLSVARGMREVMRFIRTQAESFIINQGNLRDWHLTIFKDVVPLSYYAGNFRRDDAARPCLARNVTVGIYQGSDYHIVPTEMSDYSSALRSCTVQTESLMTAQPSFANKVRAVLQLASWGVGRFVQVHPFLNGNGRISRLLASYFFVRYGLGLAHFEALPRPHGDYVAAMQNCMRGDFTALYQYFVVLLASQKPI